MTRASDDIAVYGLDLDTIGEETGAFEAVLSSAERSEISRLAQPQQRRRVSVSRGALRMIVGAWLDMPAGSVDLVRDARGRPSLNVGSGAGGQRLYLSCSRSGRHAVFAVARGSPIGIDVEIATHDRFPERIAELILSPLEYATYASLRSEERARWLARAWVLKEALLKGLGCGLEVEPRSINAAEGLEDTAADFCKRTAQRASAFPGWHLHELARGSSVIAIATRRAVAALQFVDLDVCHPQFANAPAPEAGAAR